MEKTQEQDLTYYFAERERRKTVMKNFARKSIKGVSTYLSLILVVPALLGGIWQVLELTSIRLQLIRFFSASQLIPDGLIVMIFLAFASVGISLMIGIYVIDPPKQPPTPILEKDEPKHALGNAVTAILVFTAYHFFMNYLSIGLYTKPTGHNLWMLFLAVAGFLFITFLLLKGFTETKFGPGKVEGLLHYHMSYFIVGGYLYCLSRVFIMFHAIFMVPKDLVNTQQIECKVESLYPKNAHKLQYFNDKYAFIEIYDTIKLAKKDSIAGKILILNFEEFLKEKNCVQDGVLEIKTNTKIKYN